MAHRQRQTTRFWRLWILGALTSVLATGCGDEVKKVPCVQMMAGDLVAQAAAFRLDVFANAVTCAGNDIAQDGVAPVYTTTVQRGQPLKIEMLKPGSYTLLVTTYSNPEATHPTGAACLAETITPGAQVCFSAHVEKVPPGCHHTESRCCTPADCTQVPDPAACKQGICEHMGDSCSYGTKMTASICGGVCCNSVGGKCDSQCRIACDVGKGDCNNVAADGCEHDLSTDPANCGACGRACAAAGTLDVATPMCANNVCNSQCQPGFADCAHPAAPKADDGCECNTPGCCADFCQRIHDNGFGGKFYNCIIQKDHTEPSAKDAATQFDPSGQLLPVGFTDMSNNHFDAWCNFNSVNCTCYTWNTNNSNTGAVGHARQTPVSKPPNAGTDCKVATDAEPAFPEWN